MLISMQQTETKTDDWLTKTETGQTDGQTATDQENGRTAKKTGRQVLVVLKLGDH